MGGLKEGEADFDASLDIRKQLAADFPSRPEFRQDVANGHNDRGVLLKATGRQKEAEAEYDAALSIFKQLAADFPSRSQLRRAEPPTPDQPGSVVTGARRVK